MQIEKVFDEEETILVQRLLLGRIMLRLDE